MIKRSAFFPSVCCLLVASLHCQRVGNVLQGHYTRDAKPSLGEYEIVVPRKVRSDGEFVSHQIPHHFKRSFYEDKRKAGLSTEDALHYRLRIENEEHHLELYPNHHLAGYIRAGRSWYTIEPVLGHEFAEETEHPHIVYKRRANEFGTADEFLCNVTGRKLKSVAKRSSTARDGHANAKSRYTLELLLVLGKSLSDHRKDFDVVNYALTLLNMAAGLFHDVSLGVSMELTLVRIIKLDVEDDQMSLSTNKDVAGTLKYFEEWQRMMNPGDDSHPNHHDCAILISKTDICVSSSLCGFTGTSTIAAACDPLKGAAILNDVGLRTGYHMAHHIGHTLGMPHDVEEDNGCPGVVYHQDGRVETTIMHPGGGYVPKKWSKCSRTSLRSYIEAGLGHCLEDEPRGHRFPSMDLLPGVMYNADDQCRLQYRQDSRQCDLGVRCDRLRCAVPGKGCVSTGWPPSEGTSCDEDRWCYGMKCVVIGDRPGAVDGGWNEWSGWSGCSRSCGSGVAFSARRCNKPSPSKGGAYCRGDRKRYKICATDPCEIGGPSFRDVQCAEFNDWLFPEDGKVHHWKAYNLPGDLRASEDPCALYCVSERDSVVSLRPKVADGTTCYRGIRDICVDGVCKEIPCDLDMQSSAVEDVCGVCRGDSTSCRLKEGAVSLVADTRLRKILNVPAGSTNIRLEATEPTKSRIIVRTRDTKTVLVDGNRLGMFAVSGSRAWLGMIRPRQEALNIPGPVADDLVILVLPRGNATFRYSLGLKERSPRKPVFSWDFVGWERCSANCGPAEQISKPRCVEKHGGLVDDKFCKNIAKPDAKVRPCYQAACLPRWMLGDWQGCVPCVPGCARKRAVKCVRPLGHDEQDVDVIADSHCPGAKPRDSESCSSRRKRDDVLKHDPTNKNLVSLQYSKKSLHQKESPLQRDLIAKNSELDGPNEEQEKGSGVQNSLKDLAAFSKTEGSQCRVGNASRELGDNLVGSKHEKRSGLHEGVTASGYEGKKETVVVDREDIERLTLTIILERDDQNNVINFPKSFEPRPPGNATEFTLVGMDAVRYIQMIQEEKLSTTMSFS